MQKSTGNAISGLGIWDFEENFHAVSDLTLFGLSPKRPSS